MATRILPISSYHLINLLFYGMLCFCLSLHLSFRNDIPYVIFEHTLQKAIRAEKEDTKKLIADVKDNYGMPQYNMPCYGNALTIDSISTSLYHFIDSSINTLAQANVISDKQFRAAIKIKIDSFKSIAFAKLQHPHTEYPELVNTLIFDEYTYQGSAGHIKKLMLRAMQYQVLNFSHIAILYSWFGCMPIVEDWDSHQAIVYPICSYVFPGQKVKALAMYAEYSKGKYLKVNSNDAKIIQNENMVATIACSSNTPGHHTVTGTATTVLFNDTITRPWSLQYYVGSGKNPFNIDNMDICYLNVPHILTVDIPEPASSINIDVQGAKVRKLSKNTFELTVTDKNIKNLYVYANKGVAGRVLKVRRLTKPIPLFAGKRNTTISMQELDASITTISANDDFDYPATVTRFSIDVIKAGYKSSATKESIPGNTLPADVKSSLSPGDKLYITDIVAKDDYGNKLPLETISFSIAQ